MITISKKVEYSILLLSYLSKKEVGVVSLTDASKKLSLPYRFMGQLAAALKEAGIVDSKEGKTGGYSLKTGWENKSLYDLLEALGENKHMVKCLGDGVTCAREDSCKLRHVWDKMEKVFVNELKVIKLAEL